MSDLFYCPQAKALLEAFAVTIHDVVRLHEEQFEALFGDDADSTRFDALIHTANQRKLQAKYAYLQHLEAHRCSAFSTPSSDSHLATAR